MPRAAFIECLAKVLDSVSGESWKSDQPQNPPTDDTTSEPLETKVPVLPRAGSSSLWDSEIDGVYMLEIPMSRSEDTGDMINRLLSDPESSTRRSVSEVGTSLSAAGELVRHILWGGPGGPQRPMPA
jgi:hypothetical protein